MGFNRRYMHLYVYTYVYPPKTHLFVTFIRSYNEFCIFWNPFFILGILILMYTYGLFLSHNGLHYNPWTLDLAKLAKVANLAGFKMQGDLYIYIHSIYVDDIKGIYIYPIHQWWYPSTTEALKMMILIGKPSESISIAGCSWTKCAQTHCELHSSVGHTVHHMSSLNPLWKFVAFYSWKRFY